MERQSSSRDETVAESSEGQESEEKLDLDAEPLNLSEEQLDEKLKVFLGKKNDIKY